MIDPVACYPTGITHRIACDDQCSTITYGCAGKGINDDAYRFIACSLLSMWSSCICTYVVTVSLSAAALHFPDAWLSFIQDDNSFVLCLTECAKGTGIAHHYKLIWKKYVLRLIHNSQMQVVTESDANVRNIILGTPTSRWLEWLCIPWKIYRSSTSIARSASMEYYPC